MNDRRDWKALLTDAKARGVSMADLAREQRVSPVAVFHQIARYSIVLPRGKPATKTGCDWSAVLSDAAERRLTKCEVAIAHGVTPQAVHRHCRVLGIELRWQSREAA